MKKTSLTIIMMLVMFAFMATFIVSAQEVTTHYVNADESIQRAINNASDDDIIIVNSTATVTYFDGDIEVNKSITLKSRDGSALTWINGTVNITNSSVTIGGVGDIGFTIYQKTINKTKIHAVNVSTNGSLDDITIRDCIIIGGYDGVHIGRSAENATSNLTIYNCTINNTGRSAIRAGLGQLVIANFSSITAYNTSNNIYGDIICIDGGNDVLIYNCTLYDTTTEGGMGINSTGATNNLTNFRIDKNTIYNVGGYSPICIVSTSNATNVSNVRITFNELENNSNPYSEAAIRFDNLDGKITATNISVFYNNINTSGHDIEEQFGAVGTYNNWTGVMKAYFNWYGSDAAGNFTNSSHLYASPWLRLDSAVGNIWNGTDYLDGNLTEDFINATAVSDVYLGTIENITSTGHVVIVVYPYGLGGSPESTNPARSMHNYREIGVSNASLITFPVNITVYYDADDLLIRGWSESYIKGLVFYNETSSAWEEFNSTGKNTTYNTSEYEGYVWGVAYTKAQLTGAVICINFKQITPEEEDENGVVPDEDEELDSDGDGYTNLEEVLAGSDPYDAASTPLTIVAVPSFLGLDWYWWIVIAVIIIFLIIAIYFALSPKAWKKFKKKF